MGSIARRPGAGRARQAPPVRHPGLEQIRGLHPPTIKRRGQAILDAIARGAAPPIPRDEARARSEPGDAPLIALAEALLRARALEAGLAYELIASRAELELIVAAARRGEPEPDVRTLTGWRRELVGDDLRDLLAGRGAVAVGPGAACRAYVDPLSSISDIAGERSNITRDRAIAISGERLIHPSRRPSGRVGGGVCQPQLVARRLGRPLRRRRVAKVQPSACRWSARWRAVPPSSVSAVADRPAAPRSRGWRRGHSGGRARRHGAEPGSGTPDSSTLPESRRPPRPPATGASTTDSHEQCQSLLDLVDDVSGVLGRQRSAFAPRAVRRRDSRAARSAPRPQTGTERRPRRLAADVPLEPSKP